MHATAEPFVGFEDEHGVSRPLEVAGGDESGQPGADHDAVGQGAQDDDGSAVRSALAESSMGLKAGSLSRHRSRKRS